MTGFASCIFEGTVVHKRLSPRQHGFSYRVFALCLDVDEIPAIDASLRLFSRNRFNLLGIRDEDLGAAGCDPIATKVRTLLARCGLAASGSRIELVCYPRLFGFVFNPLSVYFCSDADGEVTTMIYEVTNTFGERKCYVVPTDRDHPTSQSCAKEMYVSPFTDAGGTYGFHCVAPSERVVIGVNFREGTRPVLKTHFSGKRRALTDASILSLVTFHPLMTVKVFSAIHFEAARLWAKGVPLVERHTSPAFSFSVVQRAPRTTHHAR